MCAVFSFTEGVKEFNSCLPIGHILPFSEKAVNMMGKRVGIREI
jgi:hypothetical protein